MPHPFYQRTFTPTVRDIQTRMGSRASYARVEAGADSEVDLGDAEREFIAQRDGFYQSSVGADGWPYVQHRGGSKGFLKVLDSQTLAYADFRGNRQYISVGNLTDCPRVAMILMDYAQQRRLKLLGEVSIVEAKNDPALMARLALPGYRATAERAIVIRVVGLDWNCPQHITPRYTWDEFEAASEKKHAF